MKTQRGFSLIEVLVAGTVLTTALLGLSGLMVHNLELTVKGRDRLVAEVLLRDLEGRLALSGGAVSWRPPSGRSAAEWSGWQRWTAAAFPEGRGVLCRDASPEDGDATAPACDGSGPLVAKMFWQRALGPGTGRQVVVLEP